MKPYFGSEERQKALFQELEEWKGTPWRHACHVKGAGTDCIGFVYQALVNLGVVDPAITEIPVYNRDWHVHNDEELLYNGMKATPGLEEIDKEAPRLSGDLWLFHFGKAASHVGIWFDKRIYHAVTKLKVISSSCNEGIWADHLKFRFRAMEQGE